MGASFSSLSGSDRWVALRLLALALDVTMVEDADEVDDVADSATKE